MGSAHREREGDPMNYLVDFDAFRGRIGNLYGKKNLCPPFELTRYAQGWWIDGIEPAHCIEQVRRHLEQCSHQYRCGSSDKGIWVFVESSGRFSGLDA
jgi:hypothetical protein